MFLLHCIVLELNCTVWYCKVLRGTLRYSTVFNCASTVLYFTVLYCTVLYCTVLYCTVMYCTVLYIFLRVWCKTKLLIFVESYDIGTSYTWKVLICYFLFFAWSRGEVRGHFALYENELEKVEGGGAWRLMDWVSWRRRGLKK